MSTKTICRDDSLAKIIFIYSYDTVIVISLAYFFWQVPIVMRQSNSGSNYSREFALSTAPIRFKKMAKESAQSCL